MDRSTLYRFFEGNCTEDEIKEVRNWIEISPENKKTFYHESSVFDAATLLSSGALSSDCPKRPIRMRILARELLKIAATIFVMLSCVGLWQYAGKQGQEQSMSIINVPAGKNANLVLPDGTKVWMNARTTIKYPSSFGKNKRDIFLDGEAYFEVTSDESKPFIVHAKAYDINVLGTKFNVDAYSFRPDFVVSLMEGSLKIKSVTDSGSLLLKPSQLAYLANNKMLSAPITDYNPYRWREGLICFDNILFPELMKLFEKYYDIDICIENNLVKDYICTGKFRQTDGIDYALNILKKDINFKYNREENSNIIHIK
ncbi:MAG: FecR family protein [Prevotella sp.]|jgi:ferric-dicitrate binding protein FerR (iron transport regulator)|nr:FecR family protein [Prevotella sp.]